MLHAVCTPQVPLPTDEPIDLPLMDHGSIRRSMAKPSRDLLQRPASDRRRGASKTSQIVESLRGLSEPLRAWFQIRVKLGRARQGRDTGACRGDLADPPIRPGDGGQR